MRVATVPCGSAYADAVLPLDVVHVGPACGPSPWLDSAYLADHAFDIDWSAFAASIGRHQVDGE